MVALLKALGYTYQDADEWMIEFAIGKVETYIKSACNITEIPSALKAAVVERSCGEFLQMKMASGQLDETFDCGEAVSSVQAGDTNVSFDTSQSSAQRLEGLIASLLLSGEGALVCYRKIRW